MAEKSFEDKIPPEFMSDAVSVLKLEYEYIKKKRQLTIRLRRSLKNKKPSDIVEMIKFIGGKPLKSLDCLMSCKSKNLPSKVKKEDNEMLIYFLDCVLNNCSESYLSKKKYIESVIGAYLDDNDK